MTEHCGQTQSPADHLRRWTEKRDAQIHEHTQTLREILLNQTFANHFYNANTTSAPRPTPNPLPFPGSPAETSLPSQDSNPPFWSEHSPSFSSPGPSLPERFSGNPSKLKGFLFQCRLFFGFHDSSFLNNKDRIAFVVSFLSGEALEWAETKFPPKTRENCTFEKFIQEFERTFSQVSKFSVSCNLLNTKQGNRSVAEFSSEFQGRAAVSGWNESALKSAFLLALNESVRTKLSFYVEPANLEDLIELAIG